MKANLKLSAVAAALAAIASAPASATSWTTSTGSGTSITALQTSISCNSTTGCQSGTTTGSGWITVTAYSTNVYNSTTAAAPVVTGGWLAAQLTIYNGNGFGISNANAGNSAVECYGCTPQHAIDNSGVYDILVVDFGAANTSTNFSSLSLGYMCDITSANGCAADNIVNVDAFIGNNLTAAITGGFTNTTSTALSSYGFTGINLTNDPSANALRADTNTPDAVGRYLVITPGLGAGTSAFKISNITATPSTGVSGGVPLPGSLPLLGLGLAALGLGRKRRS